MIMNYIEIEKTDMCQKNVNWKPADNVQTAVKIQAGSITA